MGAANPNSMPWAVAWPYGPTTLSVLCVILVAIVTLIFRVIRYRQDFKKLLGPKNAPPYSMLFGSIPGIVETLKAIPYDCHPQSYLTEYARRYNIGSIIFLDTWPVFSYPQMVITDPAVAAQVVQTSSLPKHPEVKNAIRHICGPTSMIYTEGELWKRTRALFNPGFAMGHLMTLVPGIVNDTLVFRRILYDYAASGEIFSMERVAARLTVDIMGHIVLDHDLNSQTAKNELMYSFEGAVKWTSNASPISFFYKFNFVRPIMQWYHERRMNRYIKKVLEDRYKLREDSNGLYIATKRGRKPAIDLALDAFISEERDETRPRKDDRLGMKFFNQSVIDQMKTFVFAGHDTTGSTISYICYLLGKHPESLAKVREEYDAVFGKDITATADLLRENPSLINKLVYTTAVIKETLRLYPAASSVRIGDSKTHIAHNGVKYPTEGYLVWVSVHGIHRNPNIFPSPDEYIPERFLPAPHNWQDVPKDAWRPFEKGPRSCIGQELAMLEAKIIMALTLREFDVRDAYEEWDRKLGREKPGDMLDGKRGMFGYRSYQVLQATAKPIDGMPMTVKRRAV